MTTGHNSNSPSPDIARTEATNRRIQEWCAQLREAYPTLAQDQILQLACAHVVAELEYEARNSPAEIARRVRGRHPIWDEAQIGSEAAFLLARYQDLAYAPLDAGDTEARRLENTAAHADDANKHRGYCL